MSFAACSNPASVMEEGNGVGAAILSSAAVGRTAWSSSSLGPRECSAPGDATATPAAIATTQNGAANSIIRLRMWCVFLGLGLSARARKGGVGLGEMGRPYRRVLPEGNFPEGTL